VHRIAPASQWFSFGLGGTIRLEAAIPGVHLAPRAAVLYVLNGPNLNLLGEREPEVYGHTTLAQIGKLVSARAKTHGLGVEFRQSNHEGELVDWLHEARKKAVAVILNAGAYTHTSVALLDACRALAKPLIEVHLSNPYARETFRRRSYISQVATGVICGLGPDGYIAAVDALARYLKEHRA
jgi:3-dehydroquinate dehydratase-2